MFFGGKIFRIGTLRYNWPMSAHASQAFIIVHCTDSEDLPFLASKLNSHNSIITVTVSKNVRQIWHQCNQEQY